MKPVIQSNIGMCGNCLAACIASVLEVPLDEVPQPTAESFTDPEGWQRYMEQIRDWLAPRNLGMLCSGFGGWLPDGYCLAGVRVCRESTMTHSVIFFNGELAHDPHPVHQGRFHSIEDFLVFYLLDPSRCV